MPGAEGVSSDAEITSRATKVVGAFPLVVLGAVVAVESGERSALSQAVDGIQEHFHVSDFAMGLLPAALTIVGALGAFPFGYLTDRVRRTALLTIAMVAWIAVVGLNALAPTFLLLFAVRLGIGIVEANQSAALSLLCDYYPVRDRARTLGLWQSGNLVGSLVGIGVGGVLVDQFGWRAAFWMWIAPGLVVVGLLLKLREPVRGESDIELSQAEETEDPAATVGFDLPEPTRTGVLDYGTATWRDCYRELLRIRSMWFALVGITVAHGLVYAVSFWAVPFFKRTYGLSSSAAGGAVAAFGIGVAIGYVAGGSVADRLLKRGVVNARIYVVAAASVLMGVFFFSAFSMPSFGASVPLFLLGGVFLTVAIGPIEATLSDVVVAPLRGRAAAIRALVRSMSALAAPLVGLLADVWNLRVAFQLMTPLCVIGGLIVLGAARTYPTDLSFVLAESRRIRDEDALVPNRVEP